MIRTYVNGRACIPHPQCMSETCIESSILEQVIMAKQIRSKESKTFR